MTGCVDQDAGAEKSHSFIGSQTLSGTTYGVR